VANTFSKTIVDSETTLPELKQRTSATIREIEHARLKARQVIAESRKLLAKLDKILDGDPNSNSDGAEQWQAEHQNSAGNEARRDPS
jgi:hypothetical protein